MSETPEVYEPEAEPEAEPAPMATATAINNRIIELLGEIHPDNGYLTDAGLRVFRGWVADFGDPGDLSQWPAIRVATRTDTAVQTAGRKMDLRREIDIDAHVHSRADDYEPALDAVVQDIRRALLPWLDDEHLNAFGARVTRVIWGDAIYTERPAGSDIITARLSLTVSYVLTI